MYIGTLIPESKNLSPTLLVQIYINYSNFKLIKYFDYAKFYQLEGFNDPQKNRHKL